MPARMKRAGLQPPADHRALHPILRSLSDISCDFRRDLPRGFRQASPPTTRFNATEPSQGHGGAEWIQPCMSPLGGTLGQA